jgi:hypothetical protein
MFQFEVTRSSKGGVLPLYVVAKAHGHAKTHSTKAFLTFHRDFLRLEKSAVTDVNAWTLSNLAVFDD